MGERIDTYMNICPVCSRSFFCEHKRDYRCPYCRISELEAKAEAYDAMCEVGLIQFDPNIENHIFSVWGFTCWHHDHDILKAIAAANDPVRLPAAE